MGNSVGRTRGGAGKHEKVHRVRKADWERKKVNQVEGSEKQDLDWERAKLEPRLSRGQGYTI